MRYKLSDNNNKLINTVLCPLLKNTDSGNLTFCFIIVVSCVSFCGMGVTALLVFGTSTI